VGTPLRVLVPVLTAWPDNRLWLHLEPCHAEHRRRRSEEVDALLRWALSPTSMRADRGENQTREGGGSKLCTCSAQDRCSSQTRDAAKFEADFGSTP
jgi:hypothetical protein